MQSELRAKIQHYNWVEANDLIQALDAVVVLCVEAQNDIDVSGFAEGILEVIKGKLN